LYENGIWASARAFSWRRKIEEWGLSRSGESWKEKKQAFLHKFPGKLGVSEMGFRFLTCKWVLSEGLLREMEKTQMRERGRDERERRNTKKREVEREREREREREDGWEEKTARRRDKLRERRKTEKREWRDDHFFGIKKKIILMI